MARTLEEKLSGKRRSKVTRHSGRPGSRHDHKFTIGDQDAFVTLMEKNTTTLSGDGRKRLLRAVQDATRRFNASSSMERDAFLHGLVTGYAVAFKISEECADTAELPASGAMDSGRASVRAKSTAAGTMGVA